MSSATQDWIWSLPERLTTHEVVSIVEERGARELPAAGGYRSWEPDGTSTMTIRWKKRAA